MACQSLSGEGCWPSREWEQLLVSGSCSRLVLWSLVSLSCAWALSVEPRSSDQHPSPPRTEKKDNFFPSCSVNGISTA
eukprot:jgi/Mesvir1/10741/Mv25434-RA.1